MNPFCLLLKRLSLALLVIAALVACSATPTEIQASPDTQAATTAAPAYPASQEAPYPVTTGLASTGTALEAGVVTIRGTVLSGGDQTPAGLQDAPRQFVYQVKLNDGSQINVAYMAYPPSPAAEQNPVTLDFYAGQIQAGDLIDAQGEFDPSTQTLTVSQAGDFIRTSAGNAYP